MPNSAVMMGRPMAMTEPNATSRMMMAARMPMASVDPGTAWATLLMASPPSSIWSPSPAAPSAVSTRSWTDEVGMSSTGASNTTVA